MAIQMRRGQLADYDEDKMVAGEFAVTTDEDTEDQQVYVAFAPGVSKRILTETDLQDLTATKIWTGSCGTMNSNRAKTVTLDRPSNFTLINNTTLVLVRFTFGNSQSSPTLNVSGTGAFPIRYNDGNGNVVELTDDTFYKTLGGVRLFRYTTNGTDSWWDIENITQYDAQRIRNAIEQKDQAWRNSLAPAYSTSGTYAVGDHVVYNGQLYECNTAITTAEAWTAAHWTAVTVGEELTDLKADFTQYNTNVFLLESGTFADADGTTKTASNRRVRNKYRIAINDIKKITAPSGYNLWWFALGESGTLLQSTSGWVNYIEISALPSGTLYINFAIRNQSTPTSDISSQLPTIQAGLIVERISDYIADTAYQKPSGGIPLTDLASNETTVSGSTPTITGAAGYRYICGEVSTLSITAPASGCIDVLFESGSTATVLTVTSAKTGVSAVKWANSFDPTSLDANTVYELNILDGEYGVACQWT